MRLVYRGLLVAFVQALIVCTLAGKFYYDRSVLPRVWARTIPFDPDLPIRGRYVRLQLVVEGYGREQPAGETRNIQWVELAVENNRLSATPSRPGRGHPVRWIENQEEEVAALVRPIAFFIPEHVPDPSQTSPGEELWAQVTVPAKGPPRPIRLGIKKEGRLEPLQLR